MEMPVIVASQRDSGRKVDLQIAEATAASISARTTTSTSASDIPRRVARVRTVEIDAGLVLRRQREIVA